MYNYSYPLLFIIWFECHVASIRFATVRAGYMNNHNPRVALDEMVAGKGAKGGKYSPRLLAKLQRRQAAHENCLEMIGIFAATVVAGNTSGVSAEWMNGFSVAYFALRGIYSVFPSDVLGIELIAAVWQYINIATNEWSMLRTLTWYTMNGLIFTTLLKCGKALNGGVGLLG